MKQIALILVIALTACAVRSAIISSNLLTLVTVNNSTNTGAAIILGQAALPQTTVAVQSVGTGGTNLFSGGNILVGLSTNIATMTTVGSYTATNDTIASLSLTNNGVVTIYCAFQAFNTSNLPVQIGAQSIKQQ